MEKYDKYASIACIGPAGERLYKAASIHVTEFRIGHFSRAADRGGIGALMGVKGLKAIVIDNAENRYEIEYENAELFKKSCAGMSNFMSEKARNSYYHEVSTVSISDGCETVGLHIGC